MLSNSDGNGNGRIEALLKREAALKAVINAEKVKQQKRREKEHQRHALILGNCLLAQFEADPSMGRLLEETLQRFSNPRDAEFLRARGWRI